MLRKPTSAERIPKGEIFELLRNQRRRYVLHYLKRDPGPVELGSLAQQIAAWEYDTIPSEVTPEQRKRIYTTLQQTHLPKMDEAGILRFDRDAGLIERTDRTTDVTIYLEIVPKSEIPWRELYLSLGAISLAIVAALWGGVYPLTAVPDLAWAGVIAGTFTVASIVHIYYERSMRVGHGEEPPELRFGRE